jgi:hypothetical protein
MTETYTKNGQTYTKSNHRLRYDPKIHFRYGEKWTKEELAELCGLWKTEKATDIAIGLGRTVGTCYNKVRKLKEYGLFDYYKKCFYKGEEER